MKIAIGMNIQDGPFGGGNQFGKSLTQFLINHGHQVFFDLTEQDLDIILLTDPRVYLHSVSFGPVEVINYIQQTNKNAILVHRVNECDERKGTTSVNKELEKANSIMDHTIYIASWLVDLFKNQGLQFTKNYSVIKNGADNAIFTFQQKQLKQGQKIKIITHHWSTHPNKGWDVYAYLNEALGHEPLCHQFEFHYVGHLPKGFHNNHIIVHPPCAGKELANILQKADVYLSASINEPAGMHHIEGALCGLPLLYRESGALPEYCQNYGISFHDTSDVLTRLQLLIEKYDYFAKRMKEYDNTSDKMNSEYLQLFERLIQSKEAIYKRRTKKLESIWYRLHMQLFFWSRRLFAKLFSNFYAKKTPSTVHVENVSKKTH